jgi:Arc/MetJ-type ribon-helix-helix transcriptional regulator
MPTRKVVLTKHQEKVIEMLVGSGRYRNASEILRDACIWWSNVKLKTPPRNVVLTKHQEKVIEMLVGSGRYQNASEILWEACIWWSNVKLKTPQS